MLQDMNDAQENATKDSDLEQVVSICQKTQRRSRNMAIDFKVIDKDCIKFQKPYKITSLPEKFPKFFLDNEIYFPISASRSLCSLDPYDDTLLSYGELEMIQQLCEQIRTIFTDIKDHSIYDTLKRSGIKQKDLLDLSDSMQDLITYALDNDKAVWAVGD